MAHAHAAALTPEVEAPCVVCGAGGRELVCSEAQLRAQTAYLHQFHRRRLRPARERRSDHPLADRAEFTQDYTTDVVACRGCGLVLRDPRPPARDVLEAYAADEYGKARLTAMFESQLQSARGKLRQLRRRIRRSASPRVIEIGSFVGGFLAAAGELGWHAVGVDPGEEVVAFCRGKGLQVYQTAAAEAAIAKRSADCVAIWNTFDQLPDPRPTLAAARRWLRADGLLVIRVPNGDVFRAAMRLRAGLPFDGPLMAALAWNNLLGFPYLYGYSPRTLDRLVAGFGFARQSVQPDTLVRLADADTAPWAAWEERMLKGLWRSVARLDLRIAPWFDVYYRSTRNEALRAPPILTFPRKGGRNFSKRRSPQLYRQIPLAACIFAEDG
jgi:SAM-dependent methyltransferase